MTIQEELAKIEERQSKVTQLPVVYQFEIRPVHGNPITVEGNQWFCHAHEVRALRAAACSPEGGDITRLIAACDVLAEEMDYQGGVESGGLMTTRWRARQALAKATTILRGEP